MENLEILQEKYNDLLKEFKSLQLDYYVVVKNNSLLRKRIEKLKTILSDKQR